jgi:cytochrome P450 family 12
MFKKQILKIYKIFRLLRKEFGEIVSFPGVFGQPPVIMTFNVDNFEKVYRTEGQYPFRRGFDTLTHYRKTIRPEIYGEFGSLLTE